MEHNFKTSCSLVRRVNYLSKCPPRNLRIIILILKRQILIHSRDSFNLAKLTKKNLPKTISCAKELYIIWMVTNVWFFLLRLRHVEPHLLLLMNECTLLLILSNFVISDFVEWSLHAFMGFHLESKKVRTTVFSIINIITGTGTAH